MQNMDTAERQLLQIHRVANNAKTMQLMSDVTF